MKRGQRLRKRPAALVGVAITFYVALFMGGCDSAPKGEAPTAEKPTTEQPTKRVTFDQLFEVTGDTAKPKSVIRYQGTTFTPDVPFEVQVMSINSVPFSQLIGRDAEVRTSGGVTEVLKFY